MTNTSIPSRTRWVCTRAPRLVEDRTRWSSPWRGHRETGVANRGGVRVQGSTEPRSGIRLGFGAVHNRECVTHGRIGGPLFLPGEVNADPARSPFLRLHLFVLCALGQSNC